MTTQLTTDPASSSAETMIGRILSWVVGLALGVLFGVMGTAVSQSRLTVFGVGIPVGIIVALTAVALLLVGLRLALRTRTVAILAAVGIVLAVFLLSQPSPGGSVLVPNNALGLAWTFGPTIIALVVLAWPRLSKN